MQRPAGAVVLQKVGGELRDQKTIYVTGTEDIDLNESDEVVRRKRKSECRRSGCVVMQKGHLVTIQGPGLGLRKIKNGLALFIPAWYR